MTYLISQLWIYLLCTAAIGLLLGWIIWGWFGRSRLAEANAFHEKRHLSLERAFEADRILLEEGRAAACLAREEALKTKASLIGEVEGERKARAEACAEIDRLIQAETATREQLESRLVGMQNQLEMERSTAEEAKEAVGAIREDMTLQLREKQMALSSSEDAARTLRTKFSKLEIEARQGHDERERRLGLEREATTVLQTELQKDRHELSEAKDLIDTLRADMNRQLHASQAETSSAENSAMEAKRALKEVRAELDLLKATATGENERAGKTAGEHVRQTMQRALDDERRARASAEADHSRLGESEREARAEVERLREKLSSLSSSGVVSGAKQQAAVNGDHLGLELEESRRRERSLESEVARLRDLSNRPKASAAKAKARFQTDAPRPSSLYEHRPDTVDDLKDIKGIGPVMERILNENGCYQFQQLASFSTRDIEWVSAAIETFPDRIERDNWVGQAQALDLEKYGRSHRTDEARTLETTS